MMEKPIEDFTKYVDAIQPRLTRALDNLSEATSNRFSYSYQPSLRAVGGSLEKLDFLVHTNLMSAQDPTTNILITLRRKGGLELRDGGIRITFKVMDDLVAHLKSLTNRPTAYRPAASRSDLKASRTFDGGPT